MVLQGSNGTQHGVLGFSLLQAPEIGKLALNGATLMHWCMSFVSGHKLKQSTSLSASTREKVFR